MPVLLLLLYSMPKAVFISCENVAKDHLAGNGDPMHEVCIPHRVYRACEQQEEEADTRTTVAE